MQYWVIPPKANGEFVARMEAVLDIYGLPSDPNIPVIVMDEQPVQLFRETRTPIPATKNHARRVDYEYERAWRIFFCLPIPLIVGVVFLYGKRKQKSTGRRRLEICWRRTTRTWKKCDWCVTT